jgi:CRP/FNR family cyclic AMP-dependent transcriptional regulator
MRRLRIPAGEYVYKQDEPSEALFLVRSGKVDITVTYPETGEAVDASHGPGHIFGEVELIDNRARVANARVTTPAELVVFDRSELLEILFESPEKSLLLGKTTYERLKELFSDQSLDSELARLREEMKQTIQQAVVSHESRVVRSHNGMLAIAAPIIVMVVLAVGAYWFFHRA